MCIIWSGEGVGGLGYTALCCTKVFVFFPPPRLFSHVDDPFLDDPLPREFVLYLRPSGPLQNQLSHFWQQSRVTCGKNKAHNIFPHITLCQFFMVSSVLLGLQGVKWHLKGVLWSSLVNGQTCVYSSERLVLCAFPHKTKTQSKAHLCCRGQLMGILIKGVTMWRYQRMYWYGEINLYFVITL